MKQETYPVAYFKYERDLWKHLEPALDRLNSGIAEPVPVAVTLGAVIDRYKKEHLSELAKSTRDVDTSMLESTIRPKWGETQIAEIRPMEVPAWMKTLPLATPTKQRAKRLLRQLFDKAVFWEMIPFGPNPMTLVKVIHTALHSHALEPTEWGLRPVSGFLKIFQWLSRLIFKRNGETDEGTRRKTTLGTLEALVQPRAKGIFARHCRFDRVEHLWHLAPVRRRREAPA
ncbi:MAG: hypothetical protein WCE75_08535 [Terracidiphilus sp.]